MAPNHPLPFKIGEQGESESFMKGFRGAWFRCKINKLVHTKDPVKALLEFYDYPGEKMHWTQLYQKPNRFINEQKPRLILRPCFPPWYHENQMPDPCTISDLIVIADEVWKVGDLVDWWYEGCYWSGKITHLLGKDKVQIVLPDPPIGEGKSYEAFCNDLRPSLNWSLEHGWTVPVSRESKTSQSCARLVQPLRKDEGGKKNCTVVNNTTDNEQDTYKLEEYDGGCASCDTWTSVSSSAHAGSLLSPFRYVGPPRVNKKSRQSPEREDNVREMEVQSTKVSLDLDDGRKEIANSFCMVSSSLMPPSGYRNPRVINTSYTGREETEDETEVQSTNMNLTLADGVSTNSLGKASSAHASSSSLQVGHMTPEPGSKETEHEMEIQSTNMIMDLERRGTTNRFDKASTTPASTLLPSTGYTSPKISGRSTQGSDGENTEEEEVQSTSMDFGSVCDRRGTTSRLQKASSTVGSSFLSSEVNDISGPGSGREETERNREIQSTAMSLESDDSRRKITSSSEISGQRPGRKVDENKEVQYTDMNLNSDASRKEMIDSLDQALGTSSVPLLPVRCLSPEIGETFMQSSRMEETEQRAAVHPTGMKSDSYVVGKQTGMVYNFSLSPGALLLPDECHNPETNDTIILEMGKTARNADAQMLNINLDSEHGGRLPTNLLDRTSRLHEMNTSMDLTKVSCGNDQHNFWQFPKRSRINETHHPASVTEVNSTESSILELEELANKIRWLKWLIIFGLRWSTMKPSWKFSET